MGQSNSYQIDQLKLKSPGLESSLKINQQSIEEEKQDITKINICQNNLFLFTKNSLNKYDSSEKKLIKIQIDQMEPKMLQECQQIMPIPGRNLLQAKFELSQLGQKKFIEKWKID